MDKLNIAPGTSTPGCTWRSSRWSPASLGCGRSASFPRGSFGDEATDGLDALDVLAGRGAVFFPANFGREGLHIWLVAGAFRLLGITSLALRLPSVLAGILTALATYWLAANWWPPGSAGCPSQPGMQRTLLSFIPLIAGFTQHLLLAHPFQPFWYTRCLHAAVRGLGFRSFLAGDQPGREGTGDDLPAGRHNEAAACSIVGSPVDLRANRANLIPACSLIMVWFAVSGLFLGLSLHFYTASRFLPFFLAGFLASSG